MQIRMPRRFAFLESFDQLGTPTGHRSECLSAPWQRKPNSRARVVLAAAARQPRRATPALTSERHLLRDRALYCFFYSAVMKPSERYGCGEAC